jgi:hypothetical protein
MVIFQILRLHTVDALADNNLGMLGIADIAVKYAVTAFPPDSIALLPHWRDARGNGRRAPRVALARLPRRAAGQSGPTGHRSLPRYHTASVPGAARSR